MIISASRRTDIPAYYSDWFMNRIRAGYCQVPNPFNFSQMAEVSLTPEDVDAIVFWSKDPSPMLSSLQELDSRGYRYYFLFTLNDYPKELEPKVPPLHNRINTFHRLSDALGPQRVIWRYDPIILSTWTNCDYHRRAFAYLVDQLKGYTTRVIISVLDFYRKTERRLRQLEADGVAFERTPFQNPQIPGLLADLQRLATQAGMGIQSCSEEQAVADAGIPPGSCIDPYLLNNLCGMPIQKPDPHQRRACACATAKDIGMVNSCLHGCPYCYATVSDTAADRNYKKHDPASSLLIGAPLPNKRR